MPEDAHKELTLQLMPLLDDRLECVMLTHCIQETHGPGMSCWLGHDRPRPGNFLEGSLGMSSKRKYLRDLC